MCPQPAMCGEAWQKFITLGSVKTNQAPLGGPQPGYGPSPAPRANRRRTDISTARAGLLGILIDQPEPCTIRSLAALTRQHPNTIREHLDGLVDDRLAVRTRAPAEGRGRPAWLYAAAPDVGSEPGTKEYAGLASALAGQIARTSPRPGADAIEAGRMWGRDLVRRAPVAAGETAAPTAVAARRQVVTMLEELGFAPSPDSRVNVVKLRRCPLLEAAHQHPEVVCGVHLGVVLGALDELGADPDRTKEIALHPFSEPGACSLIMLPRTAAPR